MDNAKRNLIFGIVAVALLGFAGYRLFSTTRNPIRLPEDITTYGVCLACGQDAIVGHKLRANAPFECQRCGEMAVYPWYYCYDCMRRFVPPLGRDNPNEPAHVLPMPRCTACGCRAVAPYDPERPDQAPVEDVEPPEWPIQ
jgi:DNA-directed RNA polymerase subunit RPC12/RpoP